MFDKIKSNPVNKNGDAAPSYAAKVMGAGQQPSTAAQSSAAPDSRETVSSISSGMTIVGKISGEGTVNIFGRVEGELHASTVLVAPGAQVEGDLVAEELTIGGQVKGTIRANRVKLNSTAVVEGDIFHRSLTIEENARFEGSSRREEKAIEKASGIQANRPQPQVVSIDDKLKRNGAPDKEGHANPAIPSRQ